MLIVDLSNNQGTVDFKRLRLSGVEAVWLKASEGVSWNDPVFHERASAARRAGLRVGGYHFARPDNNTAKAEALHFATQLGVVQRRDLRPVLDFETHPATESWARTFNREFKDLTGLIPVFYSYPAFIQEMRLAEPIGDGLWLASYSRNDGKRYPVQVPAPWRRYVAHQFTSKARISGVSGYVDVSYAPRRRGVLAHPVIGL